MPRVPRGFAAVIAAFSVFAAGFIAGSGTLPRVLAHVPLQLAGKLGNTHVATPTLQPPALPRPGEGTLVMVGDVLPLADRDYLQAVAPLLAGADYCIGNLECPLSMHGTQNKSKLDSRLRPLPNEYLFRAPPSQARRLAAAGFDGFTLANNHIMDFGPEALLETMALLERRGVSYTGAGRDCRDARNPILFQAAGQTVAVLAYASSLVLPGTEGFAAGDALAGTVFVSPRTNGKPTEHTLQMLQNDISAAGKKADLVVVCFHWGKEGAERPTDFQRQLAHSTVDFGAGLVVGHHPHVLQGIEIHNGTPIIYSLGNFVFPTSSEANRYSAALELRLEAGRWRELRLHPVELRCSIGAPFPARGDALQRVMTRINALSAEFGTRCGVCQAGANPHVLIRNTDWSIERDELLVAEKECFFIQHHPRLEGMAVVHFLAWAIADQRRLPQQREVTVTTKLASEVLAIFTEIYLKSGRFPIHDIVGYNYRTVAGGSGLSNHALGRAIDLNRPENPMIVNGRKVVHPDEPPYEPREWRPGVDPYSITPEGPVVRAFKSRGWRWGGDWTSRKDYQHFDKPR